MTNQERFLNFLLTNSLAGTGTISEITGTACPCMISRDSSNPSYSEKWHRDNPVGDGDEDCASTGTIDPGKTTTVTTFKAIFATPHMVAGVIPGSKELLDSIGEKSNSDLYLWGLVNTTTLAVIPILEKSEYVTYITYDSINYLIRDAWEILDQGYACRLVRKV